MLEQRLGHRFRDSRLLEAALRHRSFAQERKGLDDNERLEFLGDAVLGLLVSERLLALYPELTEGRLTKIKASLVSADGLFAIAQELALGEVVQLGRAEERNAGRTKKSLLADAAEALLAAVYLDGGIEAARRVVERWFTPERIKAAHAGLEVLNAKSTLQERLQALRSPAPTYVVAAEEGPPHARRFRIRLTLGDQRFEAEGASKREAEQSAARQALEWLASGATVG